MEVVQGKPLHIFRVGDYSGKGKYSREDLLRIADRYNEAQQSEDPQSRKQAPIKFDHEDRGPAAGFVTSLFVDGDNLYAIPEYIAAFEATLKSGAWRNRSVEFYKAKGGNELRAVALLGAARPEIGGLDPLKFDEGEFETIEFDSTGVYARFDEPTTTQPNEESNAMPDKTTPDPIEVTQFKEIADRAERTEAENRNLRRDLQETKTRLAAKEAADGIVRFSDAWDECRRNGQVPEGIKAMAQTVYGVLPSGDTTVVRFSENGETTSVTAQEFFLKFLSRLPKNSDLRRVTADDSLVFEESEKQKQEKEKDDKVDKVDEDALFTEARKYQDEEKKGGHDVTMSEATSHVRRMMEAKKAKK